MARYLTIESRLPEVQGELSPELVDCISRHNAPFSYTEAYLQYEFSYTEEARNARRYIRSSPEILEITGLVSKIYQRPRTRIDTRLGTFNSRPGHNLATTPHIDNDFRHTVGYFPMRTWVCVVGAPTVAYIGEFAFDTQTGKVIPKNLELTQQLRQGVVYELGESTVHSEPPRSPDGTFRIFWRQWVDV